MSVMIETSAGTIVIDLYTKRAPRSAQNFIHLCKLKHYNNSIFSRIIKDYTASCTSLANQSQSAWSSSSTPKQYFCPENHEKLKHKTRGTVSWTTAFEKQSVLFAGSNFFITLKDSIEDLNMNHAVFGRVVEGLEILDKMNQTLLDLCQRPFEDIIINHTIILDDGCQVIQGLTYPSSPVPDQDLLNALRLPIENSREETDTQKRIAKADASELTLELIGDRHSFQTKQTILFICKLNPITTSDDLRLIFSRFGPINKIDLKREKGGRSLCFGFVEFEEKEACEMAYFKMDNCLIDDYRIKVDFSQSAGKMDDNDRRIKESKSISKKEDGNTTKSEKSIQGKKTFLANDKLHAISKDSYETSSRWKIRRSPDVKKRDRSHSIDKPMKSIK